MSKFLVFTWLVAFNATVAFAQIAPKDGCLDPARIQQVMRDYRLQSWNPSLGEKGDWQDVQSIDACNNQDLAHRVIESVLFLEDFPSANFPVDDFDQNIFAGAPIDFFKSRIHTIQLEPTDSVGCGTNVVAFVSNSSSANTMHICPYAMNFSLLSTDSVLMHESRHIDGFPHSICNEGLYQGAFACDSSYAAKGSYAVGVEFYVKSYRNQNLSPAVRDEARSSAVADLMVRFNQAPLGLGEGLLLLSDEGTVSFFDGTNASVMVTGVPSTTVTTIRDLPAFYDIPNGTVTGYSGRAPMVDLAGTFAQEFRDMPLEKRQTLLDVNYGNINCFLFTDSVHCEQGSDAITWPLPAGLKPIQFMSLAPLASNLVFIVGEGTDTYTLPTGMHLKGWTIDQFKKNDTPALDPFKNLTTLAGGRHFGLSRDGVFMWVKKPGDPWTPMPDFQDSRFKKLIGPAFWSPRLMDL